MTTKTEADRRFERFRATVRKNPAFIPLDLEYERALFSAIFDPLPLPPEPESKSKSEPKTLGQVAHEAYYLDPGDHMFRFASAQFRRDWERAAAAVIAEYERRRKKPTVEDVAKAVMDGMFVSVCWDTSSVVQRDMCRSAARAIFPLFGCEP